MLAVQAKDREISTIEGLAGKNGEYDPLQQAMHDHHGLQCGYLHARHPHDHDGILERKTPRPAKRRCARRSSGNLCRCTGYQNIVDAVMSAAMQMRG